MLNRLASVALVIALVCTVGGTSALADKKTDVTEPGVATGSSAKQSAEKPANKASQPNERLKAGLAKLVADTKAGKGKLSAQPQMQTAKRNNLSKGTKIAIGVGIVVAVVAVIVVVHARNHLFDNFRPFSN